MAAAESGGGFGQKRNTNCQVGRTDALPHAFAEWHEELCLNLLSLWTWRLFSFCLLDFAVCVCWDLHGLLIFSRAHVGGVGNGQVNFAHTGCCRQTPALGVYVARPIWLGLEGVARGVCQFIGQNKVWEGDGWVWGEGKPSPPLLWRTSCPSHTLPPYLPLDGSLNPTVSKTGAWDVRDTKWVCWSKWRP